MQQRHDNTMTKLHRLLSGAAATLWCIASAAQVPAKEAHQNEALAEVRPGRLVDVVVQQGVTLDVALRAIYPVGSTSPTRGTSFDAGRSAVLRAVRGEDDE